MSKTPAVVTAEPEVGWPAEGHLRDYVDVVVRRRWSVLAVFLCAVSVAGIRSAMTRPVYRATARVLIDRHAPAVLKFRDVADASPNWVGESEEFLHTQLEVLRSRVLARRVVEELDLLQDPEWGGPRPAEAVRRARSARPGESGLMEGAINGVLGRLRVAPVKKSRVVNVSVEAFRPDLAARLANAVAEAYIANNVEAAARANREGGEWLGGQIEAQRQKVEAAERALRQMKERGNASGADERRVVLQQRLTQLGAALTTLRTQRLEAESAYREMSRAEHPEDLPEVARDPVVQSVRLDLARLRQQEAQLLTSYFEVHPAVVKVREQIGQQRDLLKVEAERVVRTAERTYRALAAQQESLAAELEGTQRQVDEISMRLISYDSARRELEAAKAVFMSIAGRQKEAEVAQELTFSNVRLIDPAVVPRGPIRPDAWHDVALGALAGMVLALALAFLLEYFDNTIKTPEDVRTHLGPPLLGIVPEVVAAPDGKGLLALRQRQGPFLEGYRVVRTALQYCWTEKAARVVVVTSTAPGEGKTLTSANLALTLATPDTRVLLLDADLHKAGVHALFGQERRPGLSDVLVGQAALETAIRRIEGTGLDLLAAGAPSPSPGDLLVNRTMRSLVEGLRRTYDWVIVDTPPVGPVADALALASCADGVVVVVGAEAVPRKGVQQTLRRVAETGARLLGVVLNRARVQKHAYRYGHYYGHYYGHKYGEGGYGESPELGGSAG